MITRPLQPAESTLCSKNAVVKVERPDHAMQVGCRSKQDKNMEYLMRTPPDIESARILALGPAHLPIFVNIPSGAGGTGFGRR